MSIHSWVLDSCRPAGTGGWARVLRQEHVPHYALQLCVLPCSVLFSTLFCGGRKPQRISLQSYGLPFPSKAVF